MKLLLEICTILGGIAALLYFYEIINNYWNIFLKKVLISRTIDQSQKKQINLISKIIVATLYLSIAIIGKIAVKYDFNYFIFPWMIIVYILFKIMWKEWFKNYIVDKFYRFVLFGCLVTILFSTIISMFMACIVYFIGFIVVISSMDEVFSISFLLLTIISGFWFTLHLDEFDEFE